MGGRERARKDRKVESDVRGLRRVVGIDPLRLSLEVSSVSSASQELRTSKNKTMMLAHYSRWAFETGTNVLSHSLSSPSTSLQTCLMIMSSARSAAAP